MTDPREKLAATIEQWRRGIRIQHRAHEQAAASFARRGRVLAVVTILLTTVVGTSIFTSLGTDPSVGWKVATGIVSLAAAVSAALQAFLLYPETAERHRQTALKLGTLRRRLDLAVTADAVDPVAVDELRARWDDILEDAPVVPQRIFTRAEQAILGAQARVLLSDSPAPTPTTGRPDDDAAA